MTCFGGNLLACVFFSIFGRCLMNGVTKSSKSTIGSIVFDKDEKTFDRKIWSDRLFESEETVLKGSDR